MKNPRWKLVREDIVWREFPDGRQESCVITAKEYLEWLAEGNTPEIINIEVE